MDEILIWRSKRRIQLTILGSSNRGAREWETKENKIYNKKSDGHTKKQTNELPVTKAI